MAPLPGPVQAQIMDTESTTPDPPPEAISAPAGSEESPGAPAGAPLPPSHGRLHRSRQHGLVAGVAAGVADYLDLDPTLVRLGFVGLALFGGLAVPLYLAGWLLIPDEGADSSVLEEMLSHGPFREYTH